MNKNSLPFSLKSLFPENFAELIAKGQFKRDFYPSFQNRQSWKQLLRDEPMTLDLLKEADKIDDGDIPSLPLSLYCQYQTIGNRAGYEKPYFQRRRQLQILTLSMCLTGDKEKYMSRILEHVFAILEEWSWTIPAHAFWMENGLPELGFSHSDLFCNETGAVMAYCVQLIGPELDEVCPGLVDRIRQIALDRTFYNVVRNSDRHWWFNDPNPQNWSVWCSFNILVTVSILEKDPAMVAKAWEMFLVLVDRYAQKYDDDGFCMEGPIYYTKSGLMFSLIIDLMEKILPGSMEKVYAHEKVRAIFDYIAKVHIRDSYVATYGDSGRTTLPDLMGGILSAGKAISSERMLALGRYRTNQFSYNSFCGCICTELFALFFDVQCSRIVFPSEKRDAVSFYPDRLGIIRTSDFAAFVKAGNNGEAHNHNDMGQFALYDENGPVIVDAGTSKYAKINFSPMRYTLWYTRGSGHNAPMVNSVEQCFGAQYKATLSLEGKDTLRCDLSGIYTEEAKVQSLIRTAVVAEKSFAVTDEFVWKDPSAANVSQLMLLTPREVTLQENGDLLLGKDILLHGENISFVSMEEMPDLCSRESQNSWRGPLKALHFRSESACYRFVFTKA